LSRRRTPAEANTNPILATRRSFFSCGMALMVC
jgi:hypothetical protein